jgi:hypothetical protein
MLFKETVGVDFEDRKRHKYIVLVECRVLVLKQVLHILTTGL